MGLELLTEGRWEDLEEFFLDHLLHDMPGSPFEERWVLTPHHNLIRHLQGNVARRLQSCSGLRFMDFNQLARRIITCTGSSGVTELSRVARELLIRRVVQKHLPEIERTFGAPVSLTPAFMGAVTKTLSDLREAGIRESAVAELAGSRKALSRERLNVVSDLYESYMRRLSVAGTLDQEGLFHRARELMSESGVLPQRVYVYGFYDLTGGQAALLDTLFEAATVKMYVPVYPESEVYAGRLFQKWRRNAEEINAVGRESSNPLSPCSLRELWERFSGTAGFKESTVTVVSAPGKRGEVDIALRLVASAWKGGMREEDTCLIAVSPEIYSTMLSQKLESNGFTRCRKTDTPTGAEPAGTEPVEEGIDPRITVLNQLLSGLNVPGEEVSDTWEEWSEELGSMASDIFGPSYIDSIEEVVQKIRELAVIEEPADRDTVRWALNKIVRDIRTVGLIPLHNVMDLRGTRSELVVVIGMAEGSWPRKPIPDPLMLDEEREILSGGETWLLPTSRHRIHEDRLLFRLLQESGRHVVFIYPRLDEQGSIRRASPHVLEVMRGLVGGELLQEGLELLARKHTRPLGAVRPQPGEPQLGELDRDLSAAGRAIAGEEDHGLYALWECPTFRAGWQAELERWKGGPGPYSGFLTSRDAIDVSLELLGLARGGHISVSLLEDYARCPWRVMVERVLGLPAEQEEPEGLLTGAEMGQVLHDLFRDYVGWAAGKGRWPPEPGQAEADEARISNMVETRVGKAYRDRGVRFPTLERVDSRRAVKRMLGWLTWESAAAVDPDVSSALASGAGSGWFMHSVEKNFSAELELGGRTIRLKGRWDRVDRDDANNLRVIDYKTGWTKPGIAGDFEGGLGLQMPLYLLASECEFGSDGTIIGGVFFHLRPGVPGRGPTITEWTIELVKSGKGELGRLLDALLGSLESGVFIRLPHDKRRDDRTGLCRDCPSPTICRAWRLEESRRHLQSDRLLSLNVARKIGSVEVEEVEGES